MAIQKHWMVIVAAAVLLALVHTIASSPSTYLTAEDKASISRLIAASAKADGSFLGLKNTFYAVAANNELKKLASDLPDVPKKDKVCEYTKGALKTTDIQDIYYQLYTLNSLGCATTIDDKARGAIRTALSSSSKRSLLDLYYAVKAAPLAKEPVDARAVSDRILAHVDLDADALFKANVDEEEGSVYLTGLALEALATLASSGADKAKLGTALDSATKTLFSRFAEESDDVIYFADEGHNSFKVTAQVVKGIFDLASALDRKPAGLTPEQVNSVAEYLIQNKQVGTVEDAYYILGSLSSLTNNKFAVPLVVSVPRATLSSSAKGNEGFVNVRVTDLLGNTPAIGKGQVMLNKGYPVNKADKPIVTNQEFFPEVTAPGTYQFNLIGTGKADLGFYTLDIKVTPDANSKYLPVAGAKRTVKVVGEASVADCQLTVTDAKPGSEPKKYSCDGKVPDVSVQASQTVQVTFSVKAATKTVQVQQALIRLTNTTNIEKVLVVPFNGKQHSVKFTFNDLKDELYGTSGKYNAELIVGDAFLSNPSVSKLATFTVTFPDSARTNRPTSPFTPRQLIEHHFRQPEKRPPVVITTAFTAAVLAPAAIFLIGLLRIGANISNFPFSGPAFLNAVGFQGTAGAILALFALYWLHLTMIQTLVYLGFLSVPFLYFAHKNLSYLATKRSKSS